MSVSLRMAFREEGTKKHAFVVQMRDEWSASLPSIRVKGTRDKDTYLIIEVVRESLERSIFDHLPDV